jgi:hypothetical protein
MSVLKWFFGEARFGVVAFFITAAGLTYGFSKLSVRETAITGSFVRAAGGNCSDSKL